MIMIQQLMSEQDIIALHKRQFICWFDAHSRAPQHIKLLKAGEYDRYVIQEDFSIDSGPYNILGNFRHLNHPLSNACEIMAMDAAWYKYNMHLPNARGDTIQGAYTWSEQQCGIDFHINHWGTGKNTSVSVKQCKDRHDGGAYISVEMAEKILTSDESDMLAIVAPDYDEGSVSFVPTKQFKSLYSARKFSITDKGVLVLETKFDEGTTDHIHLYQKHECSN